MKYFKFGPVVQEMSFKGKFKDAQTMDNGRRLITIAHLEPSAQVS